MAIISLGDRRFTYTVSKKFIRSLNLRLKSRSSFVVSCPHLTPAFFIEKFIHQHSAWILKNSEKYHSAPSLTNLSRLSILDKNYEIILKKSSRDSVVIFEEEQKIYTNSITLTSTHIKKLFDQKLRPFALRLIHRDLKNLSRQYQLKYHHVSIRNQKSRLGSCSATGNLNFNWQIILLPPSVFRYILLHELTHTIHHNHSSKFWQQLASYDPEYKSHRQFLRTHASRIMIFS